MKNRLLISAFLGLSILISPLAHAESEPDPYPISTTMSSISVSEKSDGKVMWEINGENQMGVKVIWSKSVNPVYPPRDTDQAQWIGSEGSDHVWLKGFDGAGTYHVRVCEYLDGVCGTYSNEISIELASHEKTAKEHLKDKFSDVSDKNEVYDAVLHLKGKNVVKGYEDGSFKPDQPINRAEFLKIVMGVSKHSPSGKNCFKDVKEEWHAEYICKAHALKKVSGYEDGNFRPEQPIVYAEAAKIIVNLLALESKDSNNENWYHRYVAAMELLSAIPTSVDSFDKQVTRGDMAEMIYRIDAKKKNKSSRSYKELKERNAGSGVIKLSDAGENKVIWNHDGYSKQGYKVLYSKNAGPKYPARKSDRADYHGDSSSNFAHLKAFDGNGSYHVRVCVYDDGSCSDYSNEIKIELGGNLSTSVEIGKEVKSIKLYKKAEGKVGWDVDGYAPKGFKVVYSKTVGPKYPARTDDKAHYVGDPDKHYAFLEGFDGAGKYHVRVCEYLEGSCGVYSNEITIELSDAKKKS
jgi:predicted DNA-binding antitoxin AbrB/MazE fold protein